MVIDVTESNPLLHLVPEAGARPVEHNQEDIDVLDPLELLHHLRNVAGVPPGLRIVQTCGIFLWLRGANESTTCVLVGVWRVHRYSKRCEMSLSLILSF